MHYRVIKTRNGVPYVEIEGDRAVISEYLDVHDGVATWESELGETIFSREEMVAFPDLAEALSRWDAGDRSIEAENLAVGQLAELDGVAHAAPWHAQWEPLMRSNRDIAACRDYLEVIALLRRLAEAVDGYEYAIEPGPWGLRGTSP
jgi:hypothetical protein